MDGRVHQDGRGWPVGLVHEAVRKAVPKIHPKRIDEQVHEVASPGFRPAASEIMEQHPEAPYTAWIVA